MKTLITYYSYSGITEKVIGIFKEVLEKRSELKIQRLKPKEEITSFFGQCMAARFKKRCEIEEALFDASSYDTIIIGLPVWAFAPTPAVNTFLANLTGLKGKRAVVLLTSGSGLGVKACFKNIRKILEAKGALKIDEINIPDRQNKDNDFVASSLQQIL